MAGGFVPPTISMGRGSTTIRQRERSNPSRVLRPATEKSPCWMNTVNASDQPPDRVRGRRQLRCSRHAARQSPGRLHHRCSENRYIAPIARRVILSEDALSVLVPILEDIAGWNDAGRIRGLVRIARIADSGVGQGADRHSDYSREHVGDKRSRGSGGFKSIGCVAAVPSQRGRRYPRR